MRRLSIALFVLVAMCLTFGASSYAQTWVTANSKQVGWDTYEPPEVGTISYRVFLANAITDPDKVNPVVLGDTTDTFYLITLNTQGRYFPGVATVLTVGADEIVSEINWSDDPEGNLNNQAFGLQYFEVQAPGGFGPQ